MQEPVAVASSLLSPTPGHASNHQQGGNHPQEFRPCICSSSNSQSPGWGGFGFGVLYTQRLSMNFCRAGWRQTKRASRAFQGTPPSSSPRPSLSPSRFALLRLACRVRSGLASMGLCRLPTRRRPQWDAPSSCCLADHKPLLP